MKWVDNHKGVFNVEVVAVSSIHTQVSVNIGYSSTYSFMLKSGSTMDTEFYISYSTCKKKKKYIFVNFNECLK